MITHLFFINIGKAQYAKERMVNKKENQLDQMTSD